MTASIRLGNALSLSAVDAIALHLGHTPEGRNGSEAISGRLSTNNAGAAELSTRLRCPNVMAGALLRLESLRAIRKAITAHDEAQGLAAQQPAGRATSTITASGCTVFGRLLFPPPTAAGALRIYQHAVDGEDDPTDQASTVMGTVQLPRSLPLAARRQRR